MNRELKIFLLSTAFGVLGTLAAQYFMPSAQSEAGTQATELSGEQTTIKECTPSIVYRDKVKKELGLPPSVVADPQQQVANAIRVHAAMHPHTVSAVKNLTTGATDLFVRHDNRPLLGFEHPAFLSATYLHDEKGPVTRLSTGVALMQLSVVNLVGLVEANTRGGHALGLQARIDF